MRALRATQTRQPAGPARIAPGGLFSRGFVFLGGAAVDAVSGVFPQVLATARVSPRPTLGGLATYINDAGGTGSNLSFSPDRAACMSGATQGTWVVQFVLDNTTDSPHLFGSWNLPSTNHWLIQANTTGLIWIPADEGVSNRRRWDGSGLFTAGRLHTLALVWYGGASYVAFLDGREITLSAVDATANSIRPAPSFVHVGNYLSGAANRFSSLLAGCTPVAANRILARSLSQNPWQLFAAPLRLGWAFIVDGVTIYRPNGDVVTSWTPTGAATVAGAIGEVTASDAEYADSPDLSTPQVCTLNATAPAGTYNVRVRARRSATQGQIRVRLLDSGGTDVGGSAWQALTGTETTYTLSATTTAAADRIRIEVQA